jgi:hypothetical protein
MYGNKRNTLETKFCNWANQKSNLPETQIQASLECHVTETWYHDLKSSSDDLFLFKALFPYDAKKATINDGLEII